MTWGILNRTNYWSILHFEYADLVKGSASVNPGPKRKKCSQGFKTARRWQLMTSGEKKQCGTTWTFNMKALWDRWWYPRIIPGTSLDEALQCFTHLFDSSGLHSSCFLDASSCRSLNSCSFLMISSCCNLRDGLIFGWAACLGPWVDAVYLINEIPWAIFEANVTALHDAKTCNNYTYKANSVSKAWILSSNLQSPDLCLQAFPASTWQSTNCTMQFQSAQLDLDSSWYPTSISPSIPLQHFFFFYKMKIVFFDQRFFCYICESNMSSPAKILYKMLEIPGDLACKTKVWKGTPISSLYQHNGILMRLKFCAWRLFRSLIWQPIRC